MANTKFLDYNGLSKLVEKIKNTYVNKNEQYEANLKWGGRNFADSFGPIDCAMIPELGANRFAFGNHQGITIEYSNDGGNTWKDYGADPVDKGRLLSDGHPFVIGKVKSANPANDMLRVTLNTTVDGINCYTILNKFCIYISSQGSEGCYCTIQVAKHESPTVFLNKATNIPLAGWSGYNIINIDGITTSLGDYVPYFYGRIRFIFGCTGNTTNYPGMTIHKIYAFGGDGWVTPSNMAKFGHLYSYDCNQNATFPANVTATNFIGNASSASKLNTGTIGTSTKPIYFNNGMPAICTYELNKTVPSTAVFTDTKYTLSGDDTNNVTITDSNKSSQSITINNVQRATVATYANQYSYNGIDRDFVYDAVDGGNHYIRCKDSTILRANRTNLNKYEFIINSDSKGGCYIYDSTNAKGTIWSPNGISFEKAPENSLVSANGTFITAITNTEIQNEIDKAITL